MSKKIIIIGAAVFLILVAGVFFAYKKNLFTPLFKGGPGGIFNKSSDIALTSEKLLSSFEIKNNNLASSTAELFKARFNETKEILQKEPDNFDKWLYLGVLKKGVGDYEGSRDVFIYAGLIRPGNSTSFGNLADLYTYFLNEPQKAEASIKQAIANDPNEYSFYLSLADIYRYKFPDGNALYEKTMLDALQKFPEDPLFIGPLASYYRQTNQTQKAIEYYEKLVKLAPNNQTAKEDLVELKKAK